MEEAAENKKDYKKTFYNLFAIGFLLNLVLYLMAPAEAMMNSIILVLQLVVVFFWCKTFNEAWNSMGKKNGWIIGLIALIPYGVVLCLLIAERYLSKAGYWKGGGSFKLSK